jgi:hypothetical protein
MVSAVWEMRQLFIVQHEYSPKKVPLANDIQNYKTMCYFHVAEKWVVFTHAWCPNCL